MLKYAIDDVKYEKKESSVQIHLKGWVLEKDYYISVRGDHKEIYQFKGNQKRYDVCISNHVEITEDDYGFDVSFEIPIGYSLLEFYCVTNQKKVSVYSISLDGKKHPMHVLKNIFSLAKKSIAIEVEENGFLLPVGKMIQRFGYSLFNKKDNSIYDPMNEEQYRQWLKKHKVKKEKKFTDISYIYLKDSDVFDLSSINHTFVCFVGSDCKLYPDFDRYISNSLNYDVLYFDHDCDGKTPMFKPDYSYDTLQCVNYIGNVIIVRKELLKQFDGTKIDLYKYLLKLSDVTNRFGHVSNVLYSDTSIVDIKENQDRYQGSALVSIVIPTKDHIDDLKICIDSIIKKSSYQNYEIIVINNNSEKEESFVFFNELNKKDNIQVIDLNCEFNFSYLNNYAVKNVSKGEYVLMLNNDTEIVTSDWLEKLLYYASQKGVGSVGAFLMFPDQTIQHAGIIMGKGGIAGHAYSGVSVDEEGYGYSLKVPYDVSCCTAACLMILKEKYLEVDGLDEELKVAFNDVDFGLKLLEKRYRNVFLPDVKLFHYESKSRGMDKSAEQLKRYYSECDTMRERWNKYIEKDPFYNENFSKDDDYMLHS